ncbi:MAG: hypothetical protein CMN30_21105 [Sandaracinus sp.]|nr:hypothetical protein [Sandaracinus sp.]|tara:strand:+ start:5373 stop:6704 length:1332 start_codon:yes stop_codon:yes gene_type:complete
MRSTLAALVALVALSSMAPTAIHAQSNAEARVHFEEGNRLYARARRLRGARRTEALEGALAAYMRTLGEVRSRNALFNTLIVLEELDRPTEAWAYLMEYLAIRGLGEDERREGEAKRSALAERVAVIAVASEPPGAQVFVDRLDLAPRGSTPLELALEPGEHRLYVRLPHHATAELAVTAVRGERREVRAPLEAEPVRVTFEVMAPPGTPLVLDGEPATAGSIELAPGLHVARLEPAGGTPVERRFEVRPGEPMRVRLEASAGAARTALAQLRVTATVEVAVAVDGAPVGSGREVETSLSPGSHVVEVTPPEGPGLRRMVVVREGETTALHAQVDPPTRRLGALPHIALGLTAAGAITTLALGIRTRRLEDTNRAACVAPCPELGDEVDDAALATDIVLGATAALAVTTLILYLVDRPRGDASLDVRAAIDRRGGALQLGGRF